MKIISKLLKALSAVRGARSLQRMVRRRAWESRMREYIVIRQAALVRGQYQCKPQCITPTASPCLDQSPLEQTQAMESCPSYPEPYQAALSRWLTRLVCLPTAIKRLWRTARGWVVPYRVKSSNSMIERRDCRISLSLVSTLEWGFWLVQQGVCERHVVILMPTITTVGVFPSVGAVFAES